MKKRLIIFLASSLVGLIVLTATIGVVPLELVYHVMLGWSLHLARVIPRITFGGEVLFLALISAALFIVGFHRTARWFCRESFPQVRWTLRTSGAISLVLGIAFVAGISFVGVAHQIGWIATDPNPRLQQWYRSSHWDFHGPSMSPEALSRWALNQNLKEIGIGYHFAADVYRSIPTNLHDDAGIPLHSWMTGPPRGIGVDIGDIDFSKPWNDPVNSVCFRGIIPFYLSPEIEAMRDENGYALSHFSGNVHVVGSGPLPTKGISQSQVILAGEVATHPVAWGDPMNMRDPSRGLGRGATEFGSPTQDGATFVMLDGSVRFVSRKVDPTILRSLSIPRQMREESVSR